ncbi:MAG: hypothetical protein ABR89_10830 [Rhodobacter sp. BACL10 MAG-120910-bin24]|nr:MAG: hypothetical protein ABR89_10830 [Rhodobacter sp. BACL10 MAG-120910-bin24]
MSELANAAMLRNVLIKMEDTLGLRDLSPSERDVYYAAVTLSETSGKIVKSEDIRTHESLSNMPLPTLYRSLSELVKKKLPMSSRRHQTRFVFGSLMLLRI